MVKRAYAVKIGRKLDVVVDSWAECKRLVDGFPGAKFKGFATKFEAQGWLYSQPKAKPKKKRVDNNQWDNVKYPCIERATYRDTLTGILYKNRCIRRTAGVFTGENYKPHIGNSCPF